MNLIVRKTGTIFDFCESSNGTDYDGIIYGGSYVKLSYTNDTLSVLVDGGETKKYDLTELNYDDLSEIIGFASMLEFIDTLKTAGFTGNFNQGGATPQRTKLYCALVSQGTPAGGLPTDAPVSTELVNDIGEVTYNYINDGVYSLTCVGAFPLNKWITPVPASAYDPVSNQGGGSSPASIIMNIVRVSDDLVYIYTQEYAGVDGSGYPIWNFINNQLGNSLIRLEMLA